MADSAWFWQRLEEAKRSFAELPAWMKSQPTEEQENRATDLPGRVETLERALREIQTIAGSGGHHRGISASDWLREIKRKADRALPPLPVSSAAAREEGEAR